ncbi:DUF5329 family protein [Vibrio sinaloensis]|nr:DUF5329 family protein [Vibrio sinaloensis]
MRPSYLLLFIGLALPAYANLEQEVTRLIDNIEQSSCTFYRNGKAYSPLEAAEHIANKWDYAKDDVDNLDTFIREVASKKVGLQGNPTWSNVRINDSPAKSGCLSWLTLPLLNKRSSTTSPPQQPSTLAVLFLFIARLTSTCKNRKPSSGIIHLYLSKL